MRWAPFSHEVRLTAALGVALGAASGAAQAQELRVGAGYSPHGPEEGASVIVEYLFPPVQALKAVGTPRPFLSTQLSLDGYTNYAQGGLIWRFERQQAYLDLGAGVAVHDGSLYLARPEPGQPHEENLRRRAARDEYIEFDKRWVFHATFAVGYRLNERWAVEFEGQHWSNGQFGSDTHDGVDSLGLRAAYRF
ncbi:acyloxyacyl hydrolase [Phenylobacterium sp. 58.2.17]|uniref:acyloxyacyl hydrolase n=1 Tax=Phenylobacterium sp. 58.2.17 TaxID=2969306 RepID=UPI0022643FCC|nr:acyloxyacyl hydrolase [Phenylobacterium sp. 58.2.17]MCX7586747.1 acyloxyacyl hydrolase [Phenylobacterium sp. 58.2.17]